jgi:epoxyqueuosine reductase
LQAWLNNGMHGEMAYMEKHGITRTHADTLLPGTVSIISVRVNYVPDMRKDRETNKEFCEKELEKSVSNHQPYISLYARGRDYHKVIRNQLQKLAYCIENEFGQFGYRVAVDSAPTPEVEIARKAGLGWRGKHTLLIHPKAGSFFFLGELFTNLPLPTGPAFESNHCGQCTECINACPTQAIVKEGVVDARRCISYLTIEHHSSIPQEFREAIGTRIYGCDDCQLVCPWNKFAQPSIFADFKSRNGFDSPDLLDLLNWNEATFLRKTEGMAIRRIGFEKFQRNLAIAAGNSKPTQSLVSHLNNMREHASEMVREHIDWALDKLGENA